MSEAEYYWPARQEIGSHYICHQDGTCFSWYWNGRRWWRDMLGDSFNQDEMIANGYLGVRREQAKLQQGPQPIVPVTDTSITANLSVIPPNDNATYAASVMAKLRSAKKPGEFERIALSDVPELCRRLGAS